MKDSKVLIIVGMHRSGTSLTANWLHKCGLFIGERLLGAGRSNRTGHYEDLDFLEFHKSILIENGLTWKVADQKIQISDHNIHTAEKLIEQKNRSKQWGWKDPRTCLFLDLWHETMDEAFYLFIFRHYKDVISSLLQRRKKDLINENGKLIFKPIRILQYQLTKKRLTRVYGKAWLRYNQEIIDFIQKSSPTHYMVYSIDQLKKKDDQIIKHLIEFGFDLEYNPIEKVINKNLISPKPEIKLPLKMKKECELVWTQLAQL